MPAFKHRAIMLDPARTMEKQEYYHFMLPWLAEWGYNTLHLHLTDDQGCGLVFPSHPEFASDGAFTPEQMRAFLKAAKKHRIEVIPEIESLGHTGFITRSKSYAHLGAGSGTHGFNAIDPRHKDTRKVLADIFEDTSAIFDSDVIHVGLDEVDLSVWPRYRKLPRDEHWKVFAPHAAWVHEAVRGLGKRPAMWGDHVLSAPKMAEAFDKDVLIFDWHYDPDVDPSTVAFFCERGFEVWGCPATMCWRARIVTNATDLANVREFSAHALHFRRKGLTGMVNTVWCPWRYLSGAMDYPIAWAGHLLTDAEERGDFAAHFCRSFYGLKASDARPVAEAIVCLHETAPWSGEFRNDVHRPRELGRKLTREELRRCGAIADRCRQIVKAIRPAVRKAKRNAERLNDVVLSAQLLERVCRFALAGQSRKALGDGAALRDGCRKSWQRVRSAPWQAGKAARGFVGEDWISWIVGRVC